MFVLINLNHDGDSYLITNSLENAKKEFEDACDSWNYKVILCKPTLDGTFGFGNWGDLYGAEIIQEWEREE
jgi:hypothetical protein